MAGPTKLFPKSFANRVFTEIKNDFNTELFEQPLLCDQTGN